MTGERSRTFPFTAERADHYTIITIITIKNSGERRWWRALTSDRALRPDLENRPGITPGNADFADRCVHLLAHGSMAQEERIELSAPGLESG